MSEVVIIPTLRPDGGARLRLGKDKPTPSKGGARWRTIDRPRRRSLTDYEGEDPLVVKFDVMLDEYPNGDVEPLIRRIMGWWARNDLPYQPSPLRVTGPIPYPDLLYILTDIDHSGDAEFRKDGRRCRQQLKLELTEYVPAFVTLTKSAPAAAAQERAASSNPQAAQPRSYTVKRGDTLSKIAASLLGSHTRYQEIAKLNGLRDPNKIAVGQVLKVPAQ